jgi:hypothetical protein
MQSPQICVIQHQRVKYVRLRYELGIRSQPSRIIPRGLFTKPPLALHHAAPVRILPSHAPTDWRTGKVVS